MDAEVASVRTAEARKHRHDFDQRSLAKRGFDELPTFAHARERDGLPLCREMYPDGSLPRAVAENVPDDLLVGKSQDVSEMFACIFRVAAGVRTAQRSDRTLGAN